MLVFESKIDVGEIVDFVRIEVCSIDNGEHPYQWKTVIGVSGGLALFTDGLQGRWHHDNDFWGYAQSFDEARKKATEYALDRVRRYRDAVICEGAALTAAVEKLADISKNLEA